MTYWVAPRLPSSPPARTLGRAGEDFFNDIIYKDIFNITVQIIGEFKAGPTNEKHPALDKVFFIFFSLYL